MTGLSDQEEKVRVGQRTESKEDETRQIFVKTDDSKTVTLQVTPSQTMKDVMWKVRGRAKQRDDDRYATCQGKLFRDGDMAKDTT